MTLRAATIRLAHSNPELRPVLLPLIAKQAAPTKAGPTFHQVMNSIQNALAGAKTLEQTGRDLHYVMLVRGAQSIQQDLEEALKEVARRKLPDIVKAIDDGTWGQKKASEDAL